jgi:hypothetical protein
MKTFLFVLNCAMKTQYAVNAPSLEVAMAYGQNRFAVPFTCTLSPVQNLHWSIAKAH